MRTRHNRPIAVLLTISLPVIASGMGCAMCCGPYDDHYPVFGGRIQRADPVHGRVGSVFSDPNLAGAGPLADSNLDVVERRLLPDRQLPGVEEVPGSDPPARGILPAPESENAVPSLPERAPAEPGQTVPLLNPSGESGPGGNQTSSQWRPGVRGKRALQR